MTTSSGKPPIDELAIDSSWEEGVEPEPGFEVAKAVMSAAGDDDAPVYGVGVPYGGNDRTEEIEPIALDMPFSPDSDVMTPPLVTPALTAPRRGVNPRPPAAASRDSELKAPVAQLVLSDLFDSTPPPPGSSLEPPDPAAFSTSRPPPARGLQGLRRNKAKAREVVESAPPAVAPWAVSPQSADSKYFSSGPAAGVPPAVPPAVRSSSPPRPYPAGAPTSTAFPSDAPAQPPTSAFGRGSEPITSGGVVALPSINVLAETPFPRPNTIHSRSEQSRSERSRPPALSSQALSSHAPAASAQALSSRAGEPAVPTPLEAVLVEAESVPPPAIEEPTTPVASAPVEAVRREAPPVEVSALESAPDEVEPRSVDAVSVEAVSREAVSREAMSREAMSREAMSREAMSREAMSREAMSREAMSREAMSREAMSREAMSREAVSREAVSAEAVSVEAVTGELDALESARLDVAAAQAEAEAAEAEAAEADAKTPPAGTAAVAAPQPSPEPAGQRRNVDTLESVGNAATRPKRNSPLKSSRPRQAAADEVARFPSDIPTSRPPDVLLHGESDAAEQPSERKSSPGGRARSSAPAGPRRSSNPPPQSVLAALPSTKTGQIMLPSVMLGADVEAEPDSVTLRRAQRAARATVRIELPEGFGRPGSALLSGLSARGAATALPLPEREAPLRSTTLKAVLPWLIGGLVVLALCLAFVLRPRSGSLVVTALGAGHRAVESVQIFVDGTSLCDSSPCRISGLTAGNHQLRASAPGLSSGPEQVVEITAGEEAAANIELSPSGPDTRAGSLRVAAGEKELTLFVDDRRVGKLPQTVSGLASGKHWVKLDAEDGSPPIEKSVSVSPGETVDVDGKPAKRDKVVVTIRLNPESEGASVTFDDAFLLDFPAELELDPHSTHTLSATKPGYEDFALHLELTEEAEKQVEVALTPLEGSAHRARPRPSATAAIAPAVRKPVATSKPAASSPAVDPTQGLLNISSVPPSQIILNGRPMGSTPKTAVVVPGDSLQTIVFVHPKMGRRRAQKFVPAGKERTVSIRF